MEHLKKKPRLLLLFTRGVSLKVWDRVGSIEREIEPYKRLAPELGGIDFLTYGGESEYQYQQMLEGIVILPKKGEMSATRYSVLAPIFYRNHFRRADIIKTNQIDGSWTAIIAKALYRKKVIVRCGYLWSIFQRNRLGNGTKTNISLAVEKICLKLADVCVVATRRDAEVVRQLHGIAFSKIAIVPNFVATDVFCPLPKVEREQGLICFVGRLSPQKNVVALLEACRSLKKTRLLIIGDGELRTHIRQEAGRLNLAVEFHPSVPHLELPKYLNRANLFVLPSHYEGCPKALLEAMSCGLPVIGTNVEGIREIIKDGENGLLCEKSVEGVAGAIERVLAGGPEIARMARQAREYVIEHHSLEKVVKKELEIITWLFGK